MRFCAGIVLFNPDLDKLKLNIECIYDQVERIVLIDNASTNKDALTVLLGKLPHDICYIRNEKNEGIAKALNQILDYAEKHNYEYYLTLDQDSVCNVELIKRYKIALGPDTGQITCRIIDTDHREIDPIDFKGKTAVEVDYCITSGCINSVKAIRMAGNYDELLFIDGVDLDISLRIKRCGYCIIKIDYEGIRHELGEKKENDKRGVLKTSNHKPWRNYYARRNLIYIARKYYAGAEKYKRIWKQIVYGVGAILLEDKKIERVKYNMMGVIDGMSMPIK